MTDGFQKIWEYIISQISQVISSYEAIPDSHFEPDWVSVLRREINNVKLYWKTVSDVMEIYVVNFGALPGIPN
jgi:hypothetical protein